jgi:uridylate kinase
MLATVQNALVLRDFFNSHGIETRVASAIAMPQVCEEYIPKRALRHLDKGRVVIFAAGLGLPYFSTDSCAVQRALEMTADRLIMAKHGVEGVYSADPRKDAHAVLLKTVDATTAIEQGLAVADLSSLALAKENNLVIKVVSMEQLGNCLDEQTGSVVEPQ